MKSPGKFGIRLAFSLVEVAVAVAILGFGIISIVGLLPAALSTTRQSFERTLEARILQTIRADLFDRRFSELPESGTYYFDLDGNLTTEFAEGETAPVYIATYSRDAFVRLPDSQKNSRMATCRISIINIVRNEISTNSIHLPDNGS